MRSTLRSPFWQAVYRSLPDAVRHHHFADIERAERWDLALDAAGHALSRAKGVLARLFNTPTRPRSAH